MGIRTVCPLVKLNEPFLLKYRDALNQDCSNINHVPEEYFETCTFHHAKIWNVISLLYLAICIQMQSLLQSEEIFRPILANSGFLRSHFALFILSCARNNSDPI